MPRHGNPLELTIDLPSDQAGENARPRPTSSPIAITGVDLSSMDGGIGLTSLPPLPASPPTSPDHRREPSKNISGAWIQNKSRDRLPSDQQEQASQRQQTKAEEEEDEDAYREGSGSMSKIYHLRKNPGSTPELSLVSSAETGAKNSGEASAPPAESRPAASPYHSEDSVLTRRKDKGFRFPLARNKSLRRDSNTKLRPNGLKPDIYQPPNTAPLSANWPDQDMGLFKGKGKGKRGKSADRAIRSESDESIAAAGPAAVQKEKEKEKEKHAFISGSKNAISKAKAGSGNFLTRLGKIGRSASSGEKEVPDSEYVLKVINLPLVEQTRKTRISKSLGHCRDKTEFWMPSLPWRCIDYLNLNCESEGLYRVPGSGPQVKHWQRRFDTELDVDLLDEQELYDPNTIGSMLKTWLRELPTDIFPLDLQHKLAVELEKDDKDFNKMGRPAPKKLRNALSELSPFNYYLLFAITCHLSLLLSHQDRNRMDLNNLSICIGPCLKMERWLFNYLVGDWRHCWQGCWSEKDMFEVEQAWLKGEEYMAPASSESSVPNLSAGLQSMSVDERAVSSGGESGHSAMYEDARAFTQDEYASQRLRENGKPKPLPYRPAVATQNVNGGMGMPDRKPLMVQDVRRPATAEDRKDGGGGSKVTTPRLNGHIRTQSDLPLTPVKSTIPDPFAGRRQS